ncbi:MAG TPA: prepilin-type N-terminal cleavage/methylation domain-containing protein, partial [Herbaspirillum sp.]|nr:prepilin-type N-terminal cleavage/methylation domain-containing protein [Herbaspirillum sp.]
MPFRRRQSGLSLIELMIAMALGMGVVLASLALLQAARASYVA